MKSFLQSDIWMNFQKSLGREVFTVGETNIIKLNLPFGKNYLYVPYATEVPDLVPLAKKEGSIFIKIEPTEDGLAQALVQQGYKKSKNINPQKTVVIDLAQSDDELLGKMHSKTRYDIRIAERNGIHVSHSMKHETFWDLMQKTTARDGFWAYPKSYYAKLAEFCDVYVAYKDKTPLAAAMVLLYDETIYYLHGASDHEHRALMGPYALHWQIIQSYKLIAKSYDLWGIDAQKWPGVTRFKLRWGGRTIEYPGAFDLVISKLWYTLYHAYHILRGR